MRSIDADAIYDTLSDIFIEYLATSSNTDTRNALDSLYHTVLSAVETAPTISPDEVRGAGERILKQDNWCDDYAECSICHDEYTVPEGGLNFKFCPNCGAKMEVTSDA